MTQRLNPKLLTYQQILRQDLGMFTARAFEVIRPGDRLSWNWHIQCLTWHLQEVAAGRIRRLIITVPPRNLKSICASVALPAWFLGHAPAKQIVCASYAEVLAVNLHNLCRDVVMSPMHQLAFPNFRLRGKNTDTEFKTKEGGGRLATSVGGVLTGRGADIIIIDDPMKPTEALSETIRNYIRHWFDGTVMSRLNSKSKGAIIVVMQRLHLDDLAGHLLQRGGWVHLNLPAIAEEDERIRIGDNLWHERRVGDFLHAEREGHAELAEMTLALGSAGFSAQYQQRPVPVDGDIIKVSWFRRFQHEPLRGPDDQIIQSWDTASKANELSDYSVCTTWLIQNDSYYILDVFRARLDYPALRKCVVELAHRYRPTAILVEDKGSGTQIVQDLRQSSNLSLIPIIPKGDKKVRASNQSALIEAERVSLPQNAPWLGEFEAEIAAFPNGRHDDQVDSMSQFLTWVSDGEHNCPRIRLL